MLTPVAPNPTKHKHVPALAVTVTNAPALIAPKTTANAVSAKTTRLAVKKTAAKAVARKNNQ